MNFLAIPWDPSLGIDLGFFTIRWYSLMFVAAFLMGLRLMKKIYIEDKIPVEKLDTLFMYTIISMLVGMRLGEVFFYSWDFVSFSRQPSIFALCNFYCRSAPFHQFKKFLKKLTQQLIVKKLKLLQKQKNNQIL